MFKLNLKIAWRNLWKNKSYTLINLTGLSIGMACCILIFIFIHYQMSFDEGYKNENRIFRFVTSWKYNDNEQFSQGVPVPLAAAARNELAGIEKTAVIVKRNGIIHIKNEDGNEIVTSSESVYYTEPDFFEIFDIPWYFGQTGQALSEPNTVAISKETAIKFFGSVKKAIGKTITYGINPSMKVMGVFKDMPENSSFPLKIVISYQTFYKKKYINWDSVSSETECYVLLEKGVSIADLQQPLKKFNKKYYSQNKITGNQNNALQPLRDIHVNERYGNFAGTSIAKKEIYGLTTIGLFLILTACINFINLATAQAVNRSKEVGLRKVMGGKRKQLLFQFLSETFAISTMALLLACVLTELALPWMENLFRGHMTYSLFSQPVIFVFMAFLVLAVSFAAGFYPAMVVSRFNPVLAIKNKVVVDGGGLALRKILVVVQFCITTVLIISTLVIMKQMKYISEKSLGFNADAVTMVAVPGDSLNRTKYNTFREQIVRLPGVEEFSFCANAPMSGDVTSTVFSYNNQKISDFEIRVLSADENYFKLFNLQITAGKLFLASDTINGCVVNESFLKKLGISDPKDAIGKMLNPINANGYNIPIVGVMKDFNDKSLKESISPLMIYQQKETYSNAGIRVDSKQIMGIMKKIQDKWNTTFPNNVYSSGFVNDDIKRYYEGEHVMGALFRVFAGILIFISFIGLFGLISFVATQRTKELAIRKVLGATTLELVRMLNGSFLIMVLIANLVAFPLAYLLVNKWLSGFAYRTTVNLWPFILALFISVLITLITVSLRSYRAAKNNIINALKYE